MMGGDYWWNYDENEEEEKLIVVAKIWVKKIKDYKHDYEHHLSLFSSTGSSAARAKELKMQIQQHSQ